MACLKELGSSDGWHVFKLVLERKVLLANDALVAPQDEAETARLRGIIHALVDVYDEPERIVRLAEDADARRQPADDNHGEFLVPGSPHFYGAIRKR